MNTIISASAKLKPTDLRSILCSPFAAVLGACPMYPEPVGTVGSCTVWLKRRVDEEGLERKRARAAGEGGLRAYASRWARGCAERDVVDERVSAACAKISTCRRAQCRRCSRSVLDEGAFQTQTMVVLIQRGFRVAPNRGSHAIKCMGKVL
jgi:hypothetical protein